MKPIYAFVLLLTVLSTIAFFVDATVFKRHWDDNDYGDDFGNDFDNDYDDGRYYGGWNRPHIDDESYSHDQSSSYNKDSSEKYKKFSYDD
ncbi:28301_t:CDS:2 [Dentiscutata erythropus]|uniref:28301_t:CDS:1 n=1 Tax=Dentiscutata erythropus TaxID=1348616 RepID=A0A9N8Z356_9GLOM|nr:28301_t:CDS:2 [Dentiscutata erythropus]